MNPIPTASIQINRNLRPAGASGTVGAGASSSFPPPHLFSNSNDQNALAIARAGGNGGQVFVYTDSDLEDVQYHASIAAGGRRWGVASESSVTTRDHLTSYLHHHHSRSAPPPPPPPLSHYTHTHSIDPLTPPSSFSHTIDIPYRAGPPAPSPDSLPLTPMSLPSSTLSAPQHHHPHPTPTPSHTSASRTRINSDESIISLISTVFPSHAHTMALSSHTLEIVTPPENVLRGFIMDHNPSSCRTVFIHLLQPSPTSAQNTRPEQLSANFSQVLRPHDPMMLSSPPSSSSNSYSLSPSTSTSAPTPNYALDIRESLTALLDLASEALEATSLVLILDRTEENEHLGDTLHSLMYVGGQVIKPGAMQGGWVWDPTRWVLVGMEL